MTTLFRNETAGKVVKVSTDTTGTWLNGSEVLTDKEVALNREGHLLDAKQTNKLFAFWHAAGHAVVKVRS